jgi:hypothetical protein
VLGLRRLIILTGFMMADRAPGGRAQQTVMTCDVSRGTADHGTLDTALCFPGLLASLSAEEAATPLDARSGPLQG